MCTYLFPFAKVARIPFGAFSEENFQMTVTGMAGHLIRRLNQMSTQVFSQRMQETGYDLTPVQFAALDAVCSSPGLDQARIAAMIAYDRATIGGVIDRLEQKGLVTRTINERDRRARLVMITGKGQRVYKEVLPIIRKLQSEILTGLCAEEQRQFLRLAAKAVHLGSDTLSDGEE